MKQIGSLFEKYQKTIKPPQASVEKVCVEVINEVTGFLLTTDQLTYTLSTRTLSLQVPSIAKQEVLLQRDVIIKTLLHKLGETNSPKYIR